MKIKDVLQRDPKTHPLVNQGQARIAERQDDRSRAELKAELSTFVCEGQYAEGMQRILSSYLASLQHTSQKGAWVSGFFGSGNTEAQSAGIVQVVRRGCGRDRPIFGGAPFVSRRIRVVGDRDLA